MFTVLFPNFVKVFDIVFNSIRRVLRGIQWYSWDTSSTRVFKGGIPWVFHGRIQRVFEKYSYNNNILWYYIFV